MPVDQAELEQRVARAHERAGNPAFGDIRIKLLLRNNTALLLDLLNRELAPHKLTSTGYMAMMTMLARTDNLANPSELCTETGETRANMTRICDELVEKGFMHRVPNPDDRRRVDLSLTEEGIDLLKSIVPRLYERSKLAFADFTEEEKATLVTLLIKLNRTLVSLS